VLNLSPPKKWTFYLAVILWVLGFLAIWITKLNPEVGALSGLTGGYLLALISGLLLILGNALKGI